MFINIYLADMNGTVSGPCPMASCAISNTEHSCITTRETDILCGFICCCGFFFSLHKTVLLTAHTHTHCYHLVMNMQLMCMMSLIIYFLACCICSTLIEYHCTSKHSRLFPTEAHRMSS